MHEVRQLPHLHKAVALLLVVPFHLARPSGARLPLTRAYFSVVSLAESSSNSSVSTVRLWLVNTHMSPATPMDLRAIVSASSPGISCNALAAARAYEPPDPIASTPSSGSSTSPVPV